MCAGPQREQKCAEEPFGSAASASTMKSSAVSTHTCARARASSLIKMRQTLSAYILGPSLKPPPAPMLICAYELCNTYVLCTVWLELMRPMSDAFRTHRLHPSVSPRPSARSSVRRQSHSASQKCEGKQIILIIIIIMVRARSLALSDYSADRIGRTHRPTHRPSGENLLGLTFAFEWFATWKQNTRPQNRKKNTNTQWHLWEFATKTHYRRYAPVRNNARRECRY